LGLDDLAYDEIGVGRQKKCIFRFFDSKFEIFCLENNFNISDFKNFLKVISLYSIQDEVLFQKYDNSFKEDFSVEKIINSEMRFIVKLINWVGPSLLLDIFDGMDRNSITKLLKISIFLRYSFNNKIFKFEFIRNK
jgi:hypothetical protein